jgi:hypothetical protein
VRKLALVLLALTACFASLQASAASCYIAEVPFTSIYYQAVPLPPVASQKIAVSGVSAASAAFNRLTYIIRVNCDVTVSVKVGAAPTAAATDLRMVGDTVEYFVVQPGDKIAFITNT